VTDVPKSSIASAETGAGKPKPSDAAALADKSGTSVVAGPSSPPAAQADTVIHQTDIDVLQDAVDSAAESPAPDSSPVASADSTPTFIGRAPETADTAAQRPELPAFDESPAPAGIDPERVALLHDVSLRVKIELGRTSMLVEDVLRLSEGSVVELDKVAGDPVDVFVNDRLIARGEVLVLNDSFCVRISEVLTNDPHRISV